VQSYKRHELKQDKFANFVGKEVQLASENRRVIMIGLIALVVIIAAVAGALAYINARDDKASVALGEAMRTYTAPLRAADAPANPEVKSFTSSKERAQAAVKEFNQVAADFSSTRNGKFGRYMAGITAVEAGDLKVAEQNLSEVSGYRDRDLSALAKFALASIYRDSQRDNDAIRLYQELIEINSAAVPKSTAQFELAALYEAKKQPAEAAKVYEQIQKDEQAAKPAADKKAPAGAAAAAAQKTPIEELAGNKLQALKQAAQR
jgi:predicted negative regulator of RcsB-dependent stress response